MERTGAAADGGAAAEAGESDGAEELDGFPAPPGDAAGDARCPESTVGVKQGKWARLKHAERRWRGQKEQMSVEEPHLHRCHQKIFNVCEAQCVVLRGRVQEGILRGWADGQLREADADADAALQVLEDLVNSLTTRKAELLQADGPDPRKAGGDAGGCLPEPPPSKLDCSASPLPEELGITKKEYTTCRRKNGKRLGEWLRGREQLSELYPELHSCLEKVHKDMIKASMRVKYAMYVIVSRQQGREQGLAAAEDAVDSALTLLGGAVQSLRGDGPAIPLPVHTEPRARGEGGARGRPRQTDEDSDDCGRFLFQTARLAELRAALDAEAAEARPCGPLDEEAPSHLGGRQRPGGAQPRARADSPGCAAAAVAGQGGASGQPGARAPSPASWGGDGQQERNGVPHASGGPPGPEAAGWGPGHRTREPPLQLQ